MASNTDLVRDSAPNFSTTLANSMLVGDTSMTLQSATGLPTATAITLVIDATDSVSGASTPTLKEVVTGTLSGATVSNLLRGQDGTSAQGHASGSNVVMWITSNLWHDFQTSYLTQHGQLGTHGAVTATSVTTSAGMTNTGSFTQTGAVSLNGSWDGWVGANESWAYASATTITVPSNATTKYAIGDWVKITQSATVKHFVITGVASTVLTVVGVLPTGTTVANSAITANAYSKVRNPGITLNGILPYNPYKFSVYRNAAWTSGNQTLAKVAFDTKTFDTGTNFDVVTNNRFVAPIAGFYFFSSAVNAGAMVGGHTGTIALYKNGVQAKTGVQAEAYSAVNLNYTVSGLLQLAANDYVEVFCLADGDSGATGAVNVWFDGFLVSAT